MTNLTGMHSEYTIQLEQDVIDEGQECFVIKTPSATYYYQKEACGFSSLIDRDGNDWIGYTPSGGAEGNYRGIPNMGFNTFGHPGYALGASSWISEQRSDFLQITSKSKDDSWLVHWKFYVDHASMTAEKIGSRAWLLYEGTPGGFFRPEDQYWLASDGRIRKCDVKFRGRLPKPKWVAFCDPGTSRSLALHYEGARTKKDIYWPMEGQGGMTVFGFGRSDWRRPKMLLSKPNFSFSFALIESLEYEDIRRFCESF